MRHIFLPFSLFFRASHVVKILWPGRELSIRVLSLSLSFFLFSWIPLHLAKRGEVGRRKVKEFEETLRQHWVIKGWYIRSRYKTKGEEVQVSQECKRYWQDNLEKWPNVFLPPHHMLLRPHVDGDTPLLVLNVVNINIYIIYNLLKRRKMWKKKEEAPIIGKGNVFKEMNPIYQYYTTLPGHWTNILHSVSLNWRPTRSNSKNPCFLLVSQGQKSEFSGRNLGRHTTFLFSNTA